MLAVRRGHRGGKIRPPEPVLTPAAKFRLVEGHVDPTQRVVECLVELGEGDTDADAERHGDVVEGEGRHEAFEDLERYQVRNVNSVQ